MKNYNWKEFDERALVSQFLEYLDFAHYCFVDKDSPDRQFTSGFDFLLIKNNQVMVIEAKKATKAGTGIKKLRESQKLTCIEVSLSHSSYFVLEFLPGTIALYECEPHARSEYTVGLLAEGFEEVRQFCKVFLDLL